MFSKSCEYGIRAVIYIAEKSEEGSRSGLKDIAKATDSPEAFTAKILQQLVKHKLLLSVKGPNGGFQIDSELLKKLTLLQIVEAIDGDSVYNGCGLGLKQCNAQKPCPMHDHFSSIRQELKSMLENTSLIKLTKALRDGETVLKR